MPIDQTGIELLEKIRPAGDSNFFKRIFSIYLDSAESNVELMKQALRENNIKLLSEAAHSLKSSSGNIGATQLMKLCEQLEADCRQNNLSNIAEQSQFIINEFLHVSSYLNAKYINLTEQSQ